MSVAVKKCSSKKSLYDKRRYWYHASDTLDEPQIRLIPRNWGENRSDGEPDTTRICVAPTIEQCITALPYTFRTKLTIYRTKSPVQASCPDGVFDSNITKEGWLLKKTSFIKMGTIRFSDIEDTEKLDHVIPEAASGDDVSYSKEVLRWWRKMKIRRFLNRT